MRKRKARNLYKNQNVDLLKPIDITKFGTEDDPCFGKHWDPKADECKRCGDSELCAITVSQKQHVKRLKIESKNKFKDLEEQGETSVTFLEVWEKINKRVKKAEGKWVKIKKLEKLLKGLSIESIMKNNNYLKFNKDKTKLKWISGI